ncbi:hypothetical protein RQP46_006753 [Phenoliferia psychrophenolica]
MEQDYTSVDEFLLDAQLAEGTTLELPFWLASILSEEDMVGITLPRAYTSRIQHALAASSDAVNLRNLGGGGGAFFAGGNRLLQLTDPPGLTDALHNAFKERLVQVMDQMFFQGEAAAKAMKAWSEVKNTKAPGR